METTIITTSPSNGTDNNSTIIYKKSSSGLSTGAICGIAIPSVVALLGVVAFVSLFKGGVVAVPSIAAASSVPPANFIDTTLAKFNVQELPILSVWI